MKKRSLLPLQCIRFNHSHIENYHMRGAIVDHLNESDTMGRFPRSHQEWAKSQIRYRKIGLRLWLIRSSCGQVRIWHCRHQMLGRLVPTPLADHLKEIASQSSCMGGAPDALRYQGTCIGQQPQLQGRVLQRLACPPERRRITTAFHNKATATGNDKGSLTELDSR